MAISAIGRSLARQAFTSARPFQAGVRCIVCGRRPLSVSASQAPDAERAPAASPPAPSRPAGGPGPAARRPVPRPGPPVMLGPDGKPLEVVKVEDTGRDAWAGIATIDRGEEPNDVGRIGLLVAGDLVALLSFAAIGRFSHGEPLGPADVFLTALPFILGWFTAAPLMGGYSKDAQGGNTGRAALAAAKSWVVGAPLGLALRTLSKGYIPHVSFVIVSMVMTAVVMVGWRSGLAFFTPEAAQLPPVQAAMRRKDRKGNPFEALQMIMSLVKRW